MSEIETAPAPFQTYTRWRRETNHVAKVTEANVGQIAALIGGQVDYSEGAPVLVVTNDGRPRPWRVKVGSRVSWTGAGISNANGFNHDDTWTLEVTTPPAPESATEASACVEGEAL